MEILLFYRCGAYSQYAPAHIDIYRKMLSLSLVIVRLYFSVARLWRRTSLVGPLFQAADGRTAGRDGHAAGEERKHFNAGIYFADRASRLLLIEGGYVTMTLGRSYYYGFTTNARRHMT